MSKFDSHVPSQLLAMQQWFGNTIQTPLLDDKMGAFSITGEDSALVAPHWIKPSPTLTPPERVQIYNQQYWWRLLSIMQDYYPLVTRLFGYDDFNRTLAVPYLTAHPSTHWSLNSLGHLFTEWVKKNYQGEDALLVCESAYLDSLYHRLFFEKILPPLSLKENLDELTSTRLFLQPHVFLVEFPFNLLTFRSEMMKKEVTEWLDLDFPPLEKNPTYGFIMRASTDFFSWRVIPKDEFLVLSKFQYGISIENLCDWLENDPEAPDEAAEVSLQLWFKKWTELRLFTA